VARDGKKTFVIESYVPQLDEQTAVAITSRCRTVVRQLEDEGVALRLLRCFALIHDETYLCMVAAPDRGPVVEFSRRAGFEHDHLVEAVEIHAARPQPTERCQSRCVVDSDTT
jgi:hypothetical protein